MAPDVLASKIREIVADVTRQPVARIGDDASKDTVDGWDSLAQINIICTVEAELGITVGATEMHELTSIEKIRAAAAAQLASQSDPFAREARP